MREYGEVINEWLGGAVARQGRRHAYAVSTAREQETFFLLFAVNATFESAKSLTASDPGNILAQDQYPAGEPSSGSGFAITPTRLREPTWNEFSPLH